jgi:hypothetical protein
VSWAFAVAGALAAVTLGVSFGALGWALAARLVSADARPSVRFSAAAVVAFFIATALFWLLALCGGFRLEVVVPLVGGVAWLAGRRGDPWGRLRSDWSTAAAVGRHVARTPVGWVLFAVLLVGGAELLRGLVAPPLGWDGLTYHLLKAGRFVQAGALVTEQAPDSWRFYEYFPIGGDVLWAWVLLPFRSGLLIVGMGVLQWLAAMLGLYAAARELGAAPPLATGVATSIGAMPAMIVFLSSGYVDNAALTFFALSSVFVIRVLGGAVGEAPLAAAALGCMAGVRFTTLPLLAIGGLLLAWAILRSAAPWRRSALLLATSLVALVGAPTYLRAWWERGSPFHPVRVAIAGQVLSAGDSELERVVSWTLEDGRREQPEPSMFWSRLFYAPHENGWYTNPGPGLAPLALVAAFGAWGLARRRLWGPLGWLVAVVVVTFGALATEEMLVYRVATWANTVGRLLLPGIAALALLGAGTTGPRRGSWALGLVTLASAAGCIWSLPRGFSFAELAGLTALGAGLAAALAALGLLWRWRGRGLAGRWAWGGAAIVGVLLLAAADQVRGAQRYPLYEDAAQIAGPIYQSHPLRSDFMAAWPIWQALDGPQPLRLAVFTGWDGHGQNNYRFPLLGSRLQNEVVYVPITRDGSIVNGVDLEASRGRPDFGAWIERLRAARIDAVVSLTPVNGPETEWIRRSPELFELLVKDANGRAAAFRFHPERLPPGGLPVPALPKPAG